VTLSRPDQEEETSWKETERHKGLGLRKKRKSFSSPRPFERGRKAWSALGRRGTNGFLIKSGGERFKQAQITEKKQHGIIWIFGNA